MPSYGIMQEAPADQACAAEPGGLAADQELPKLQVVVLAPSDPGMLSYITQPAGVRSPQIVQSNNAIRANRVTESSAPDQASQGNNRPCHQPQIRHWDQGHVKSVSHRHRRTETWSHNNSRPEGAVRHERSGSGACMITGTLSPSSPRQACGYEVTQPPSAWLPQSGTTAPQGQPLVEADSLISWDEPEAALQLPGPGSKLQLASVSPAKPTLAEAILGSNCMHYQQSEQLNSSSAASPSACHNASWAAGHSSSTEVSNSALQGRGPYLYHRQPVGQLHTKCSGPQQSGPAPMQWHYEQNMSMGGGQGQETPLGLNLLQELSQQQRTHRQPAATHQQVVSDSSSGSSTPERVAFVSQGRAEEGEQTVDTLAERLPAFTQLRGPLIPEHSFEVNTVW